MKIIVVLGDKLHVNNKMSSNLKSRLDKCIEIYKTNNLVIVCGGNVCGSKCNHTEAYRMKKYILDKSEIPKNKIILEEKKLKKFEKVLISKEKNLTKRWLKVNNHIIKKNSNPNFKLYYCIHVI